ncbi:MAG: hypothetical protein WBD37_03360 [Anderseniella sp.]
MSGENRFTAEVLDRAGSTDHAATYKAFVKYSVALCFACFMILTSLCVFAFAPSGGIYLLLGFAGLIIGLICVIIDTRMEANWFLSGGFGAVFALLAAMAVS